MNVGLAIGHTYDTTATSTLTVGCLFFVVVETISFNPVEIHTLLKRIIKAAAYQRLFKLIDKSLIAEIGIGERNSSIAGAAISLAHSLALTVTAEGAYAAWQARYLRERGCDMVQGYYFSRPVPANKFAAMLRHGRATRLGPGYLPTRNTSYLSGATC